MAVIAWLRKKLKEIEYYSANRPRTAWTRAGDVALVAALLLSLPATYVVDALITRDEIVGEASLLIARNHPALSDPDAPYAWVATEDHNRFRATDGIAVGDASVELTRRKHGWPVTTSVDHEPADIVLQLYDQTATISNENIPADSPYRAAILAALERAEEATLIDALHDGESRRIIWLAWLLSAVLWWWILSIVLGSAVAILRFGWIIFNNKLSVKRMRRRRANQCEECGYDLTGLDFNERCPECGEYIY